MPTATVRATAQTLPEATPHPAEDIRALAAQFEAAWAAERVFFHGGGTDDEAKAAVARVDEITRKIVALPTTDIEMMRLKARVYLWSEADDFKTFAAKNEGDDSSGAVLVSLFRDLGADRALDYSSVKEDAR
jgi:hypothetical protein